MTDGAVETKTTTAPDEIQHSPQYYRRLVGVAGDKLRSRAITFKDFRREVAALWEKIDAAGLHEQVRALIRSDFRSVGAISFGGSRTAGME